MPIVSSARPWPGVVLLLLLPALYLSGCTPSVHSRDLLSQHPDDQPRSVELEQVPFFPQKKHQCGPAALAMMLRHSGVGVAPEELVGAVYIPDLEGSIQTEMIAAARAYGRVPYPLSPDLVAILAEVKAGNPVLVLQNLGFVWLPRWHYAVVVGYDLEQGEMILRSGTRRRQFTSFPTFENTWRRADHWAYVLVPPGTVPATANPFEYLKAALALEQTGKMGAALAAYRTASARWPDNQTALLALGNAEYAAGNLESAEEAFHKVLSHYPLAADAWNNLAYVMSARGCGETALQAIKCAQMLAPGNRNIRDSVKELMKIGRDESQGEAACRPVVCPASPGRE
jgi:hypothetical protein